MYNDTITKTSECDQDKVRQKCIMTVIKLDRNV